MFGLCYEEIEDFFVGIYLIWFCDQFNCLFILYFDCLLVNGVFNDFFIFWVVFDFYWVGIIDGDDQLCQCMVYVLLQIFVVLEGQNLVLVGWLLIIVYYMDILICNVFGNYWDLLDEVMYFFVMVVYLIYFYNVCENMEDGCVLDENYVCEIMQFFIIGLVEFCMDGIVVMDNQGCLVEIYDNMDVIGFVCVFIGFGLCGFNYWLLEDDESIYYILLEIFLVYYFSSEKIFLGIIILENIGVEVSIDIVLDMLFNYFNLVFFFSWQLIQWFIISYFMFVYVQRVVIVFEIGSY